MPVNRRRQRDYHDSSVFPVVNERSEWITVSGYRMESVCSVDLVHHPTQKGGDCMSQYVKVGRLIPGDNDEIRIIKDGTGEIGRVTKADAILTCGGPEPFPILPSGGMDLSIPRKAVNFTVNG